MPRTSTEARRRRRELARLLASRDGVTVVQAAQRFGVNPMTIRRDLKVLEGSGLALRKYGGAVAARRISFEFAFDRRHRRHLAEKRRIGQAAASRIQPGQTAFLDTGTTALEVARALAALAAPCQVVTSSLAVASELWAREPVELLLLGGRVRLGSPDLAGPGTELMLERLTANVAFLGSDGIDPEKGSFARDIDAARVAERMAQSAARVVVVADASKLGQAAPARYAEIQTIDELITDRGADKDLVAAFRRKGLTVTLV